MIYYDFKGILLQDKHRISDNISLTYHLDYYEDMQESSCPMISNSTIIFIAKNDPNSLNTKPNSKVKGSVLLMPLFNTPLFSILSDREKVNIKNEFFFHPPNTKEELIIYQLQSIEKHYIEFAFYKVHGGYVGSIDLEVRGVTDYSEYYTDISHNGKLIFFREIVDTSEAELDDSDEENYHYEYDGVREDGIVCEFIILRPQSVVQSRKNFLDNVNVQFVKQNTKARRAEVDEFSKCKFALKRLRVIKNINKYFGHNSKPAVTDSGALAYYDVVNKRLFFDTLEITDIVEGNLGINDLTNELEELSDFEWVPTNTGFIGYKRDKIFRVKVNIEKTEVNGEIVLKLKAQKPMQIGIIMNPYDMYIKTAYSCLTKDHIVI